MRTQIVTQEPPPVATEPCAPPTTPPDRDLTAREVASFWGADRVELRKCEQKRAAAIAAKEK